MAAGCRITLTMHRSDPRDPPALDPPDPRRASSTRVDRGLQCVYVNPGVHPSSSDFIHKECAYSTSANIHSEPTVPEFPAYRLGGFGLVRLRGTQGTRASIESVEEA
ncbi:hypothetical protein TgHK011_007657 [Trichoderma gracile]|nr:hypothetical protein TgHK011_007657 [Trichoderma gracile]